MIHTFLSCAAVLFNFFEICIGYLKNLIEKIKYRYFDGKLLYYAVIVDNRYIVEFDYDRWYYVLTYALYKYVFDRELFATYPYAYNDRGTSNPFGISVLSFVKENTLHYGVNKGSWNTIPETTTKKIVYACLDDILDITREMNLFKHSVFANRTITAREYGMVFCNFRRSTRPQNFSILSFVVDDDYTEKTFEMNDVVVA